MSNPLNINKEQDFQNLEKASELLQQKLRADESHADLYDQFNYRADISGCHRYFVEPYRSTVGPMVEHSEFIPFPRNISQQQNKIECALFMGVLPEINRVWMTADNLIYLWNFQKPEEYEVYDGISEVIVSVALSVPRPGIFLDTVKYLLIVATPVDIVILALCIDEETKSIKIVPTTYTLPSDNVTMLKIVGSQVGRIFMVGNDSNLYELEYSNTETSWYAALGGSQARKCRKINHFSWNWKLSNILTPLIGTNMSNDNEFSHLIVDNSRNILYAITARGQLTGLYMGQSGYETSLFVQSFDVLEEAKRFLTSSRNALESSPKPMTFGDANSGFVVSGIFPVPITESKKVHLLVILANGIRIYLSVQGSNYVFNRFGSGNLVGLEVTAVRSPPSTPLVSSLNQSMVSEELNNEIENGSLPSFIPTQALKVGQTYYSQGVCFMTLDKVQQPDELLCLFEDSINRSNVSTNETFNQQACLKEGISLGFDSSTSGGKVYDIKEVSSQIRDVTYDQLKSLYTFSSTPISDPAIREYSHHIPPLESNEPSTLPPILPLSYSNAMNSSKYDILGYEKQNLDNTALLGELSLQHLPISKVFTQRQFLVLTSNGLHVFKKLRPADVLYRCLSQQNSRVEEFARQFFSLYGSLQASAMCIALILNLPRDAGGAAFSDPLAASSATFLSSNSIQLRAMSIISALTPGPSYRSVLPSTFNPIQDSRLVLTGSGHEFNKSVTHDALYTIFSRIVRPIWLRPLIVRGSKKLANYWNPVIIDEIRKPLTLLANLLMDYYAVAIRTESKSLVQPSSSSSILPDSDRITDRIAALATQSTNQEKLLQLQAKQLEDISIRNLYLLISRCLHALSLIEIFITVDNEWKIPLDLQEIKEFSFRTIVLSSKIHDLMKKVIHKLIQAVTKSSKLELADKTMERLSLEAYYYFSPGDRYTFEASKLIEQILLTLKSPNASYSSNTDMTLLINKCIEYYLKASSYWNASEYIIGDQSELQSACLALLALGSEGRIAIVDLCIKCAEQFQNSDKLSKKTIEGDNKTNNKAKWDAGLFHGRTVLTDSLRQSCLVTCYETLTQYILWSDSSPNSLQGGIKMELSALQKATLAMLQRAVKICPDEIFHMILYSRLLKDRKEYLLNITTPFIESFLRKEDPVLLYTYLFSGSNDRPPKYILASNEMLTLATTTNDLFIDTRIDYLHKALASAERGYQFEFGKSVSNSNALVLNPSYHEERLVFDNVTEIRDRLEVAEQQQYIASKLKEFYNKYNYEELSPSNALVVYTETQRLQIESLKQLVHRVYHQLYDISSLYTDVCAKYKLWDCCLQLLSVAKNHDVEVISRLWRSFIYRLVPLNAINDNNAEFLRAKRDQSRLDIDRFSQVNGVEFENIEEWLKNLRFQIFELASKLHWDSVGGSGPLKDVAMAVVVDELEDIITTLRLDPNVSIDQNWVVKLFSDLKITEGTLIGVYLELFDVWSKKYFGKQAQLLSTLSSLLLHWIEKCAQDLDSNNGKEEACYCLQAIRSGEMRSWWEKICRFALACKDDRWRDMVDKITDESKKANQIMLSISVKRAENYRFQ